MRTMIIINLPRLIRGFGYSEIRELGLRQLIVRQLKDVWNT